MSDLSAVLAANVARLRGAAGISLGQLAERSGVAKATLFKVEKAQTNPTLDTIGAIADALGVDTVSLLNRPEHEAITVVRLGEGIDISDSVSSGQIISSLTTGQVHFEVHHQVFAKGTTQVTPGLGLNAREHVLVRSGSIEVGPLGDTALLLPGDYATYRADRPHCWRVGARKDAEVWIVLSTLRS